MPNNVKNRLKIIASGEVIEEIINKFGTYHKAQINRAFDGDIICRGESENFKVGYFNERTGVFYKNVANGEKVKFNGIPQGYEIEMTKPFMEFPDFAKVIPPPDDPAYNDLPTQREANKSPNWWRTWNIKNWGTKWSGYSFEKEGFDTFTFETAWASVPKIIKAISIKFPKAVFVYSYADEDIGYNCGIIHFECGNIMYEYYPDGGTKEAYNLSFDLNPEYKQYYKLVNGEYISIDD